MQDNRLRNLAIRITVLSVILLTIIIVASSCQDDYRNYDTGAQKPAPEMGYKITEPIKENATLSRIETPTGFPNLYFGTIIIDGCKYAYMDSHKGGPTMVHAGNCPNHKSLQAEAANGR